MSKPNTSGWGNPPRSCQKRTWGPFEIIGKPGSHSFTIWLPQQFWTVHLVFHAPQLEPVKLDPFPHFRQPPPAPVMIDRDLEFEVSEILDSKIDCHFRLGES